MLSPALAEMISLSLPVLSGRVGRLDIVWEDEGGQTLQNISLLQLQT